jgi:hypothetical protein
MHVSAAKNTRKNRIVFGRAVFYTVCVASNSLLVYLYIVLLDNGSVCKSAWQRRIIRGVDFHAILVVPKKITLLFLPVIYSCKDNILRGERGASGQWLMLVSHISDEKRHWTVLS